MVKTIPRSQVPVLALRNLVVFPQTVQQVRVGREKSVKALRNAIESHHWIFLVLQKNPQEDLRGPEDLLKVGTLCRVENVRGTDSEGYQINIRGIQKMEVSKWVDSLDYLAANLDEIEDIDDVDSGTKEIFVENILKLALESVALSPTHQRTIENSLQSHQGLQHLISMISQQFDFDLKEKQKILESSSLRDKSLQLLQVLQKFRDQLSLRKEIQEKLVSNLSETQRQQLIKEQIKTLRDELGDGETKTDEYQQKIEAAEMPEEAKKMALANLHKIQSMSSQSPEHAMLRNHLDFMLELPWRKTQFEESSLDLKKSRDILDSDHYGMEKIKKRILETLAAMKLKKKKHGSVLVLVGPPGVGKTSLAQSLSKAMGRDYVRVSLGGVRDDAEIRGHRRTYVGALPGRILTGMKKAKTTDPIFVLDEIDKLSRGFSGDPASALLEVLDPEQNAHFLDHYLDVSYDLSNVFFVCTANSLEGIPGPLLDRMEVIEVPSYTSDEKLQIAKRHLQPKKWQEYSLHSDRLVISDQALEKIISQYTREAGVRDLERKIETVFRASSEKVLSWTDEGPLRIEASDLAALLGQPRYFPELAEMKSYPGVVTGMAWTPVGGDILFVESAIVKGDGKIVVTGQLGDVMKESVQIALTLLKSKLPLLNLPYELKERDLHVHVPAGATPKDGPSAGVTLLTSLASLLLQHSVDTQLAMTGEITLRGAVLPVGGIKEKLIAAHRAGIKKIIIPSKNQKDLDDIPQEVKSGLRVSLVDTIDEVLRIAFSGEPQLLVAAGNPTSSFQSGTFTE